MAKKKVTYVFGADLSDLEKKLNKVQRKMSRMGKKMQAVGRNMTQKFTLPLVGLGAAAVTAGARFEKSMSGVEAVTGATGTKLEEMTALARKMGETTEWSASQAAEGMRFLGMAGFETGDILKAMPAMLDLATAGQLELGAAADITSNILTGFNMDAEETGRVADVLAKAAASSNTNVEQLGHAMSYAAPLASGLGLSIEEATAAVSIFSNAGIQGEKAGTTLRQVLAGLSGPSAQAQKALEGMGISAQSINPEVNSLADIIQTLKDRGLTAAQAVDLFGARAGTGLAALLSAGSEELVKYEQALKNAGGASSEMADTMRDNLMGKFDELKSALESAAISFGDVMAPTIEKATEALTKFARWLSDLSPEVKKRFATIAAVIGAGGPVLLAIGVFTSAVAALASPVGIVLAGIAAISAAWMKWGDEIKGFIQAVIDKFTALKDAVIGIKDKVTGAVEGIRDKTVGAFRSMKDKVSDSVSSLKDNTIGKFREMWDELVGHSIVPDMADQIVATYQAMTARVSEIIDIGAMNVENRMRQMAMRVASESQNAFIGLGKGEELTGGSFYAPKERTGAWFGDLDIKPVENLNSTLDETADKTSKLNMESALWADNLSKGLADAIVKGKDLGDVFDNILKQLASSVLQKLIMGFLPFADGGVIDKGKVQPYANGGIVNKPTIFPMASGAGLMGEAGPEAILPLKRNSQGDLGVASEGGGATHITMNVNAVDANSFVKMLQNNKTAITSLVVENISGNGQIRRAIQGAR